jgi:hypothetical protein
LRASTPDRARRPRQNWPRPPSFLPAAFSRFAWTSTRFYRRHNETANLLIMPGDILIAEGIRRKFEALEPVLDERSRRQ